MSIWFIHSIYLIIHLIFTYANHSHPIAAIFLIVSLWTVNCIVKTLFQQICIYLFVFIYFYFFNFINEGEGPEISEEKIQYFIKERFPYFIFTYIFPLVLLFIS